MNYSGTSQQLHIFKEERVPLDPFKSSKSLIGLTFALPAVFPAISAATSVTNTTT